MADLPGTGSIEYYLKGRAIRDAREAQNQRAQIAQQQAELRAKQLDDNWKINEIKANELKRYHDAQIQKMKADFSLNLQKSRSQLAKDVADGLIEPDLENPGEFKLTDKGTRAKIKAEEAEAIEKAKSGIRVNEAQQMIPIKAQTAGAVEQAKVPAQSVLAGIKNDFATANREDTQAFQAQQQRERLVAALNRANLAKDLKKKEKEETYRAAIDTSRQEVMEGGITLEELNKNLVGDARAKVVSNLRGEGLRILNETQRGDLKLLDETVLRYREKLGELNAIIDRQLDPRLALADGDYKSKSAEIQQDLDAIGRALKGFKGMITERDTERLKGGIPSANPGGFASIPLSSSKIREINKARVESIDKFIQEKFNAVTYGMKPEQKKAIKNRYRIPNPPASKLKNGEIPKKFNINNLPEDFEIQP